MSDIIELIHGAACVRISPDMGGAITAFTLDEQPVLRTAPADAIALRNVRLASCYPLVPYSNRIRNAELHFAGRCHVLERNFGTHPHAIHGVGWQRGWTVAEATPTRARITLEHDAVGANARAWPWPFRATQTFELARSAAQRDEAVLVVTLTLQSLAAEPFPFGLGWHPFFSKSSTTTLTFKADGVWQNDATQIPVRHAAIPEAWQFERGKALGDLALDNVFTRWNGPLTLDPQGMTVTLDADRACQFLVVYTPPKADFIALEPVTHETDAFNRAAEGATGTGFRTLPPRVAFSCTMRIAASRPSLTAESHSPR